MIKRKMLGKGLEKLALVFPADIDSKLLIYQEALEDMPIERFVFAVKWLIRNRKPPYFPVFPTPAEIIEAGKALPRPKDNATPDLIPEKFTAPEISRERLDEMLEGLYATLGIK